jgi:hypothetical protein
LVGVSVVVIDMVYGREAAVDSGGFALLGFLAVWLVLPLLLRARLRSSPQLAVHTSHPVDRAVS